MKFILAQKSRDDYNLRALNRLDSASKEAEKAGSENVLPFNFFPAYFKPNDARCWFYIIWRSIHLCFKKFL